METWLVVLISLAAVATAIGVPLVVVVRTPRRILADAAQAFEEQKKEVGAVIAADLERVRVALGSAPVAPATAAALGRAREQYGVAAERAASAAAADGRTYSTEVTACTMALAAAARELAAVAASAVGKPPPEPAPEPPCLLDPAHGASSTTVTWTPSGGLPRPVPVCAADAARIASGERPEVRMVVSEGREVPYFDVPYAQFVPWLLGYYAGFDSYLTARLLAGTPVGTHLPGHIRARHGVASDPVGEFGHLDR